jgi:hypothetical protein
MQIKVRAGRPEHRMVFPISHAEAAVSPTWYVTYEIRKRGLLHKKERSPRLTRTFLSEADAKIFALEKLKEGLVLFAGTLNPHSPKRVVLSRNIADWLGEQSEAAANSASEESRPTDAIKK